MGYTTEEIQIIKHEKRYGIVLSVFVFLLGLLAIFIYSTSIDIEFWSFKNITHILILVFACILITKLININLNNDLRNEEKTIEIKTIDKKEIMTVYEAGSGTINAPVLGSLYPKIWRLKMKSHEEFKLKIDKVLYDVDVDFFNEVNEGDIIEIHTTKRSKKLLGLKLKR